MSRLGEQFAMHPLSQDERVTCESMLAQEPSSRVLMMPTHHINEHGDLMGFRYVCNAYATGNCLPVVRTMFHGHTLVECPEAGEALIMRLMSEPAENRGRMLQFLRRVEDECVPASLDCVPENASAVTQHGTIQATGLLTVDSQHWTPELPARIGIYHAYIRGFNRDVRTHRLFIVCSGGMARASDAFCNMVIDVGKSWTAQACPNLIYYLIFSYKTFLVTCFIGRTCAIRRRPGGCARAAGGRAAGSSRAWPTPSGCPSSRSRCPHLILR